MKIVLGSVSKARAEILKSLGYDFEILVSNIDEKAISLDDAYQRPILLAQAKAQAIERQLHEPAIILTSDCTVLYDGHVREKPENEEEAREFLRSYGGKPVEVVSGVFVKNTENGKTAQGTEVAMVYFLKIPEDAIEELVKAGDILYAAGGFIAEHQALKKYIAHIEGNMDTVMGLPKILTKQLIEKVS